MSEEQAEKVADGILNFGEEIYRLKLEAEAERMQTLPLVNPDGSFLLPEGTVEAFKLSPTVDGMESVPDSPEGLSGD